MWQRRTAHKMDWSDAIKYSRNLRLGGFDDWKLPTFNELELIFSDRKILSHGETKKGPVENSYYWRKNELVYQNDLFPVFWSYNDLYDLDKARNIIYFQDNCAIRLINLRAFPLCIRREWESF